jgi:hypothetical protein
VVPVTYYTVSNHSYFLGTVALFNSLRLTGNLQPVVVLDAGLLPEEREALEPHVTLTRLDEDRGDPFTVKPYPFLLGAEGVLVLIDSDIIVTSSLSPVTDLAEAGKICVCPAWTEAARRRWFAEWKDTLQLRAELRREDWAHAGFIVLDTKHWPYLLERWWDICSLVPAEEIFASGTPFNAGDADALNALLMSEIPRDAVAILPQGDEVYPGDVKIENIETLECSVDGRAPKFIHVPDRPKPWERNGWSRRGSGVYVELMRRLLFGSDVALRLEPEQVPLWLRPGANGRIALSTLAGTSNVAFLLAKHAPDGVGEHLRRMRRRMA